MKFLGLASLLSALALLGAGSYAQTASSNPETAEAVSAAAETLKHIDAAMTPLRRSDYEKKDRRSVFPLLVRLRSQIDAVQPPAAQAATPRAESWRKLRKSISETLRQEKEFWDGLPDPDPDAAQ